MSTMIAQQLRLHIQKSKLSTAELARRSEVKPSFITDIMCGKSTNPSGIKLARVSHALGVSIATLIGMQEQEPPAGSTEGDYSAIDCISARTQASDRLPPEPYYFRRSWIEQKLGAAPENLRIYHVEGDAMAPTFYNGDMVMIDIARRVPSPPGIFLLHDSMGLSLRRLEPLPHSDTGSIEVMCDNPRYTHFTAPLANLNITGRVIWFSREMV